MIKAVLFDFDETLQDRTEAFEHYMETFLDTFRPNLSDEEREKCKEDMRLIAVILIKFIHYLLISLCIFFQIFQKTNRKVKFTKF